jgi:enediyne biosynthesis protein E4
VAFRDATAAAGIAFRLGHGGRSPLTILETASGGCAFLDYDGDGLLDVLLAGDPRCALYQNTGGGRFREVTASAGLGARGRWMGCSVGDYDGDGWPDVLLTGYRCLRLYQNRPGRGFTDATASAGLRTDLWSTSAAFFDADRDGDLDLYIAAYVQYHVGNSDLCRLGAIQSACGPEHYAPERGRFYRNEGRGRFRDATETMGFGSSSGKTWGAAVCDYDADGWPDLYLANDLLPGDLFHNRGGRRFENQGVRSGTAYDASGNLIGGMGTDWGDYDGDGWIDLAVTTYFQQPTCLYRNLNGKTFQESGEQAGLALPTRPFVSFGCGFLDADNDGDLDLFAVNGHVRDNIAAFDGSQAYRQSPQLFLNRGDGTYEEVSSQAEPIFKEPLVGRGTAVGDFDGDGDEDVLLVDLEGTARLIENRAPPGNRWLSIRLVGGRSNSEGIGARITAWSGKRRWVREVTRARSVLSAGDSRVHLGLGEALLVDRLEVTWPSGARTLQKDVRANRRLTLAE